MKSKNYITNIDVLRALSVFAVIFFHYFEFLAPAGYLGVDAFFVISGFVITLSLKNLKCSSFYELCAIFYTRRIKRIVPALLFCVLLTSLCLLILTTRPEEAVRTGAASLLGLSNIYLYLKSADYFALAASLNAFTHTWSLGVEEQFYFVFPIILYFTGFFKLGSSDFSYRRVAMPLIALTALSLAVNFFLIHEDRNAAFYMVFPRFWELSFGALAFLVSENFSHKIKLIKWDKLWAILGVILFLSLTTFGHKFSFFANILICLNIASLLILFRAKQVNIFPFNQNRKIEFFGLISYSLYLWHWPVLILAKLTLGDFLFVKIACVVLAVILSVFSYFFIETPVRRKTYTLSYSKIILLGCSVLIVVSGVLAFVTPKYSKSHNNIVAHLFNVPPVPKQQDIPCNGVSNFPETEPDPYVGCLGHARNVKKPKKLYLLGDSHAGQLVPMIEMSLNGTDYKLAFLNTEKRTDAHWAWINDTSDQAMDLKFILDNGHQGDIVAFTFHRGHLNKERDTHLSMQRAVEMNKKAHNYLKNAREYIKKLETMGITVVLMKDTPLMSSVSTSPACALQVQLFKQSVCHVSKAQDTQTRTRQAVVFDLLSEQFENTYSWDASEPLYGEKEYLDVVDQGGRYIMSDWNHITNSSSIRLHKEFSAFLLQENVGSF